MDVRDGRILTPEQVSMTPAGEQQYLREVKIPLTRQQRLMGRVGANDRCPCGSGVKFKKCCRIRGPITSPEAREEARLMIERSSSPADAG
jgi:hypothetical protein